MTIQDKEYLNLAERNGRGFLIMSMQASLVEEAISRKIVSSKAEFIQRFL